MHQSTYILIYSSYVRKRETPKEKRNIKKGKTLEYKTEFPTQNQSYRPSLKASSHINHRESHVCNKQGKETYCRWREPTCSVDFCLGNCLSIVHYFVGKLNGRQTEFLSEPPHVCRAPFHRTALVPGILSHYLPLSASPVCVSL